MQIYMKHPDMGNEHFAAERQAELEAQGWVRWPRTAAQKLGQVLVPLQDIEPPPVAEPVKRKPARPRKDAK